MTRALAVALALTTSSVALAVPAVETFDTLPCAQPEQSIGGAWVSPSGDFTLIAGGGARLYAVCVSGSPAVAAGSPFGTAVELRNDAGLPLHLTELTLVGQAGAGLGPAATTVTVVGDDGAQRVVDLSGGPVTVDLTSLRAAGASGGYGFFADGAFAMDELRYDVDDDRDGDGYIESEGDCDDLDGTRYPGAVDVPGDGVDQDCDGVDAFVPFPAMAVMPSCGAQGPIHMVWSGATPNGQVQALPAATGPGSVMATGPCAGTPLDVTPLLTPPPFASGPSGSGYVQIPRAGGSACGMQVQLLDLTTCQTSVVTVIE